MSFTGSSWQTVDKTEAIEYSIECDAKEIIKRIKDGEKLSDIQKKHVIENNTGESIKKRYDLYDTCANVKFENEYTRKLKKVDIDSIYSPDGDYKFTAFFEKIKPFEENKEIYKHTLQTVKSNSIEYKDKKMIFDSAVMGLDKGLSNEEIEEMIDVIQDSTKASNGEKIDECIQIVKEINSDKEMSIDDEMLPYLAYGFDSMDAFEPYLDFQRIKECITKIHLSEVQDHEFGD